MLTKIWGVESLFTVGEHTQLVEVHIGIGAVKIYMVDPQKTRHRSII